MNGISRRGALRSVTALIVAIWPVLFSSGVHAQESDPSAPQLVAVGSFEAWPLPEMGGHGAALVAARFGALPHGARLDLVLNTETLDIAYQDHQLGQGPLRFGARLRGEYALAGLLPDFYDGGLRIPERGFAASYVYAEASLRFDFASHHTAEIFAAGRYWFFEAIEATSPSLELPPVGAVLEPRLAYRFWDAEVEPSARDWWRWGSRLLGVMFGIEGRLYVRDDANSWGQLLANRHSGFDARNLPDNPQIALRQWLRAGWSLGGEWRLQLWEAAAYGWGEDDLTRDRFGGQTPYVIPVAGLPWASLLADRYLATELSLHLGFGDAHEVGVLVDVAWIEDIARFGSDQLEDYGLGLGVGTLLELQFGRWFIETRLGFAPEMSWHLDKPHLSGLGAIGFEIL